MEVILNEEEIECCGEGNMLLSIVFKFPDGPLKILGGPIAKKDVPLNVFDELAVLYDSMMHLLDELQKEFKIHAENCSKFMEEKK